ncbi:MAG TPA: dihydrofolate reductase [Bacteroidia bacterium]|nr:dihydrofolate reductase [Bacteroidia bacterium]
MIISLIVVADEHNGIGKNNQLLCHLPADLKYFKQTTTGHHIVMGRKTYDSVGKPLPNRVNIVITRNSLLSIPGCVVVADLQQAISYAAENGETELFITGGGTIYEQAIGIANRIYLTRIHHNFEADTFFPVIEPTMWKELSSEFNEQDEKNKYDYTFQVLERLS